jgi:hypothetical protein
MIENSSLIMKDGRSQSRKQLQLGPLASDRAILAPDLIILRYEDLVKDLEKTILPLIKILRTPCMKGRLERDMIDYLVKVCSSKLSEDEEKKRSAASSRRRRLLLEDPLVREQVKTLEAELGYQEIGYAKEYK